MKITLRLCGTFLVILLLTPTVLLADGADDFEEDANDVAGGEEDVAGGAEDVAGGAEDVREEDGVLYLTTENFDKVTGSYDTILVEFYAPWCGHCKSLAPEYSKAAFILKESQVPVPLGKVDATQSQELATRFGVTGYPTMKFKTLDGTWIDYDGGRDADGIVTWVSEKSDPDYKPPEDTVVTLTKDNFDEFINSAELVLVEFYAPWCGHCKRLAPEYEKAAQRLIHHEPPIPLGKVDAIEEKELGQQFAVSGYPSLKMFRNGRPSDYTGGRDAYGIVDHMHKFSGEAAKLLSTLSAVKNIIGVESATVIGFFDNLEDVKLRAYMNVANDRREDLTFGYSLLQEARDLYKVNPGSVVVFTPEKFQTKFEQKYSILKAAEASEDDIGAFIKEKELPLTGQFTEATAKFYERYNQKGLCLAFITVDWTFDHRDATQIWRKKIANIAKDYRDIKFAIANEEDYLTSMLKELGLDESGEEFNFGCVKNNKKYRMEPMEEFDTDEIRDFLDLLMKDKLLPQMKSQSIPKKNTGPVKVVVGKTFDQVVLDKTKDVLIEFYAPWCGHCKSLEPIYKKLAKSLKKDKNIVIAKMDATANDVPDNFKVAGFPTIYYAPATNKDNPELFDGDRTFDGFMKYLEKKATVSLGANLRDEL